MLTAHDQTGIAREWHRIPFGHSRSTPVLAIAALGAAFLFVVLGFGLRWGGTDAMEWWVDAGSILAGLLAVSSCVYAATRTAGRTRIVWLLLSTGSAAWLFGQLGWDYAELSGSDTYVTIPTYIAYFGLVFAFLAALAAISRGNRFSLLLMALDVGVLFCSLGVLFTAVFWGALEHSTMSRSGMAMTALYPVLCATVAFSVLLAPLRRGWSNRSLNLLFLGLLFETVPYLLWLTPSFQDAVGEGTSIDLFRIAGMLLIAVAAISTDEFPAVDPEVQIHVPVVLLPATLSVGAVVVLLTHLTRESLPDSLLHVLGLLTGLMLVLITLRLLFTLRGSKRLFDQLQTSMAERQRNQDLLRTVVSQAPMVLAALDREGVITFAEGRWLPALSHDSRDLVGTSVFDQYRDQPAVLDAVHTALSGKASSLVIDLGATVLDLQLMPRVDSTGQVTGATAVLVDMTERNRAEKEHAYLAALVESSDDAIIGWTLDGVITSWNRGAESVYGYTAAEVVGRPITILVPPERPEDVLEILKRIRAKEQIQHFETVRVRKDGSVIDVSLTVSPVLGPDGSVVGASTIARDISQRKIMEASLQESEERYRTIFESASIGIATSDAQGHILSANPVYQHLVGYTEAELRDMTWLELTHPDDRDQQDAYWAGIKSGDRTEGRFEKRYIRKDGAVVWGLLSLTPLQTSDGRHLFNIATVEDITERKRYEETLRHQALHDTLTDLPNRTLLRDRLQHAIAQAKRDGRSITLLVLGLERFKHVNDAFGHAIGDALLQQVASRLAHAVRESDTVARLHGDEFALVLAANNTPSALRAIRRLRNVLAPAFEATGHSFHLETRMGIALAPEHGDDPDDLLRHAVVALYAAKREQSDYAVYSPDQDSYSVQRLTLMDELLDAIDHSRLTLHFQPKVDMKTGSMRGVEALLRWPHQERGFVPPSEFIPVAEETGLIHKLSKYVLNAVRRQHERWREADLDIAIAVNLSTHNLHDREVQAAIEAMFRYGHLPRGAVEIEITETALLTHSEEALIVLERFHQLGARIVIDDFGTGYSSLAYLAQLPVDEIKIDRSFVTDMLTNDTHRVIVKSTIDLAHGLGLAATAEGVEDEATWDLLAKMKCDLIQGYYVSRPLPPDALLEWVAASQAVLPVGLSLPTVPLMLVPRASLDA